MTKATQAGRGNVPMIQGHQRLPQKNGVHHRPRLVAIPDSFVANKQTEADAKEMYVLRKCIKCQLQTRGWANVNRGEDCVCSKECYDKYVSSQEDTPVLREIKFVPGPDGHLWPEELLKKTQKQEGE